MDEKLWLNEAMTKFNKKFEKGILTVINAPTGSGKSTFIFNEFINESYKYVNGVKNGLRYSFNLDKLLYVCDTSMLKSSILRENESITKILEKNDLKLAMKSKSFDDLLSNSGKIKVITYSTLGWLLQHENAKYIIYNFIDVIFMDEIHNLFKYAIRFDSEGNTKPYTTVIESLPNLIHKSLVIGLTATPRVVFSATKDTIVNITSLFNRTEIQQIKSYKNKAIQRCSNMMNEIKRLGVIKGYITEHNFKVFIYTNTITTSKKYKEQLIKYGYNVEWLCSINNLKTNEDGELIPTMNNTQLLLRDKLLQDGILPDDLDILIVNSGYETGWNLRDERVQYVMIDSTNYDTQIQARNRVRHDIAFYIYPVITDEEGRIFEYDQYRSQIWTGGVLGNPYIRIDLDEKYIGKKLSVADKKYLVDMYGTIHFNKRDATWNTFKKDLEANLYHVHSSSKGTFIYTYEQHEKSKNKKVRGNSMNEIFINFLENEWDKKRITCQDVMDILDIGRKTFDKLIKDEEIIKYFSENRYKIGTIKNSKTKYLMKY